MKFYKILAIQTFVVVVLIHVLGQVVKLVLVTPSLLLKCQCKDHVSAKALPRVLSHFYAYFYACY